MLEWRGKCASFSVRLFASHQRLSRHAHESHHPRAINSVSIHDLVRVLDFEPACKVERLSIHKVALLAGVDGIEPPLSGPKPDALPFGYTPIRRFIAAPPTWGEKKEAPNPGAGIEPAQYHRTVSIIPGALFI